MEIKKTYVIINTVKEVDYMANETKKKVENTKKTAEKKTANKKTSTKKVETKKAPTKKVEEKKAATKRAPMKKVETPKPVEVKKEEHLDEELKAEKRRSIILLAIVGLFILSIPLVMWLDSRKGEEIYKQFVSYYTTTEQIYNENKENQNTSSSSENGDTVTVEDSYTLVYIGKTGCSYCSLFTPIITALSEEYGFTYEYIDIAEMSTSQITKMIEKGNVDASDFGTPTLVIIKNGENLSNHIGYMERETLFNYLQENGIISASAVYTKEYPYLTDISYTDYANLLAGEEKSIVVIGQTSCSFCIKAKPVLNEIAEEYGITINYLNYTNLTSEERSALTSSISYFEENSSWGTPLTLIVQNGELVGSSSGFQDKETFVTFFQTNGMI